MHLLATSLASRRLGLRGFARRASTLAAAACLAALVAACGGGGGDDSSAAGGDDTPPSVVMPGYTAGTASVSVVMPAGSSITADKVTVETSLGDVTASAAGQATVSVYSDSDMGSQLALVLSPAGKPMMMGWVDATHSTISVQTTAHVLAYFAIGGGRLLSNADAQALIAAIPSAPGIADLEAAVQNSLAADPDSLAAANDAVETALSTFATNLLQGLQTTTGASGRAKAQSMLIQPETQSGITALQDPPFSAHLSNAYRRRAWAFVDRVSHTAGGHDVPDAAPVTDFEVPPTVGLSGGVTGAITDIVSAYYGNQPTAYASIDAPDGGFTLTPVDGADKTTFQVTVVGPGYSAGSAGTLTDRQSSEQLEISITGFVRDFAGPLFGNIILGSGALNFTDGYAEGSLGAFGANFATALTSDIANIVSTAPQTADYIKKGDWYHAMIDLRNDVGGNAALRQLFIGAFQATAGRRFDVSAVATMAGHFDQVLNRAGGLMQLFDTGAYMRDMASSGQADAFQIVVTPPKVQLTPATTQMGRGGTQVLTASVQGVDDLSGASFHWTSTHAFGDLSEVAGGGRQHQTDYCSSSAQAVFTYENSAADGTTDTVSVEIFPGSNCDASRGASYGKATATVTLNTQPVTEAGHLFIDQREPYPGDIVYIIEVQFADVPGATRYAVHGEGPYDPVWWGSSLDIGYDPANPPQGYFGALDHAVGLSGGSGATAASIGADAARFNGWTFTVTAYFD